MRVVCIQYNFYLSNYLLALFFVSYDAYLLKSGLHHTGYT
jgi:hypothetical protein